MPTSMEKLECKIRAVNKANQYAQEISPILANVFAPFVGQKIEKVDGSLLKKIDELVPTFDTVHLVYRWKSNYSLIYCVKTCEVIEDYCHYYETSIHVGEMLNGVLVKLNDVYTAPEPANANDIMEKREICKQAKEAADKAQADLFPFGEYEV